MMAATLTIEESLSLLHEPGETFEVRILGVPKAGTVAGYFDNSKDAAAAIAQYDGKATGVYATMNPVAPSLMARSSNRLKAWAKYATKDGDVTRRRWLLIDVDYHRPSGISATDAELSDAERVTRAVKEYLEDGCDWPAGVLANSGNGGHIFYRVDLPAGPESASLVKRVLLSLAKTFDSPGGVEVDTTVFNASRIAKVPGTMACKGDDLPDRPHRRSMVMDVPPELTPVSESALLAIAGPSAGKASQPPSGNGSGPFDVERFMAASGLTVRLHKQENGGDLWELEECPFNQEHNHGEAFISRAASGALLAGCHHNSCTWRWEDLRDLKEPGYKERRREWEARQQSPPPTATTLTVEDFEDPQPEKEEKSGPRFVTAEEFEQLTPERIDYLIWGYVARGMITQLAAGIKVGKTVFIMDAIRALLTEGDFLGHMTQRCPVLYMTEEGRASFRRNLEKSHLLGRPDLHILLRQETHGMKWSEVGPIVLDYIVKYQIGLVVTDTVSDWVDLAGDGEKDESAARRSVSVMRRWCNEAGCGVVALQHERKGGGSIGESARGSTAFGGAMDILVTLQEHAKIADRDKNPTQRILSARGRCDVPEPVVVDFDKQDHGYSLVGGLRLVNAITDDEKILANLPSVCCDYATRRYLSNATGMTDTTLRRHLERLERAGNIASTRSPRKDGKGDRTLYWSIRSKS